MRVDDHTLTLLTFTNYDKTVGWSSADEVNKITWSFHQPDPGEGNPSLDYPGESAAVVSSYYNDRDGEDGHILDTVGVPALGSPSKFIMFGPTHRYLVTSDLKHLWNKEFSIDFFMSVPHRTIRSHIPFNSAAFSNECDHGFAPFTIVSSNRVDDAYGYELWHDITLGSYIASGSTFDIANGDLMADTVIEGQSTKYWHHYYVGCDGQSKIYIGVDGHIKTVYNYPGYIEAMRDFDFILGTSLNNGNSESNYYFTIHAGIDNFRVSDICRWTSDFTSPSSIYDYAVTQTNVMLVKDQDNKIYSVDNNTFKQVGTLAQNATDEDLDDLFNGYGMSSVSKDNLSSLTSPYKILFKKSVSNKPNVELTAIPKPQTILPVDLIDISEYTHVDNMQLTTTTSGNGKIRVAITKDKSTYYAYNNGSFNVVAIENIGTSGNTPAQLNSIPESAWHTFTEDVNNIALAYYISIQSVSDVASIDELKIQLDHKDVNGYATWDYAIYTYIYSYGQLVETLVTHQYF